MHACIPCLLHLRAWKHVPVIKKKKKETGKIEISFPFKTDILAFGVPNCDWP